MPSEAVAETNDAAAQLAAALGMASSSERETLEARIAALQDALPCALQLWLRSDDEPCWQRFATLAPANADFATTFPCVDHDRFVPDWLADLPPGSGPQRAPLATDYEALAAPLIADRRKRALAAAVALVPSAEGQFALRAAELALRQLELEAENDRLRHENVVFAQQVSDDFEELTFLRVMASHLELEGSSLDSLYVVSQTLDALQRLIGAETLCYVQRETNGRAVVAVQRPVPVTQDADAARLLQRVVALHCVEGSNRLIVRNNEACQTGLHGLSGLRQLLVVPVGSGTRHFGWFMAINRNTLPGMSGPSPMLQLGHSEYGTWEASLLGAAATIVASHASNLELLHEKEALLVNVVRSFVSAIDAKDAYTRGHSERVALFARCVAKQLGYDPQQIERLYLAALLHDVGKIGVKDAVLNKPGKLEEHELREIERHPDAGWAILNDLRQLNYVLPGLLHHHERFDGQGYPDRLAGADIPLDARILAVVDSYDAMTSDRAYRQGMSHERALAILHEGAGTQWDPLVVAAFDEVIEEILHIRSAYVPRERPLRLGPELGSVRE